MDEQIALILSTGTKVIISEEVVLGGVLKRSLIVNYVLPSQGTVTETWEYTESAQSKSWGAIKSVYYQLTSANDLDTLAVRKLRSCGEIVVNDLLSALKNQNLTLENTATLLNKLVTVLVLCLSGSLGAASIIASNLTTDALYTSARKAWLINKIQTEI